MNSGAGRFIRLLNSSSAVINGIGALIFNVGDSKVHCIDELSTEELTIEDRNPNQKNKSHHAMSRRWNRSSEGPLEAEGIQNRG